MRVALAQVGAGLHNEGVRTFADAAGFRGPAGRADAAGRYRKCVPCRVCYNLARSTVWARMFKLALLTLAIVTAISGGAVAQSVAPTRDVVPDSKTAVAAGGAFLLAYFHGKYRPESPGYDAGLTGDVWTVWERLPCTNCIGGGPTLEMSKRDGRVLRIYLSSERRP
jgi:hypothetical protein